VCHSSQPIIQRPFLLTTAPPPLPLRRRLWFFPALPKKEGSRLDPFVCSCFRKSLRNLTPWTETFSLRPFLSFWFLTLYNQVYSSSPETTNHLTSAPTFRYIRRTLDFPHPHISGFRKSQTFPDPPPPPPYQTLPDLFYPLYRHLSPNPLADLLYKTGGRTHFIWRRF